MDHRMDEMNLGSDEETAGSDEDRAKAIWQMKHDYNLQARQSRQ